MFYLSYRKNLVLTTVTILHWGRSGRAYAGTPHMSKNVSVRANSPLHKGSGCEELSGGSHEPLTSACSPLHKGRGSEEPSGGSHGPLTSACSPLHKGRGCEKLSMMKARGSQEPLRCPENGMILEWFESSSQEEVRKQEVGALRIKC